MTHILPLNETHLGTVIPLNDAYFPVEHTEIIGESDDCNLFYIN